MKFFPFLGLFQPHSLGRVVMLHKLNGIFHLPQMIWLVACHVTNKPENKFLLVFVRTKAVPTSGKFFGH